MPAQTEQRVTVDNIRHKVGCPEKEGRVESFDAQKPDRTGGGWLTVTRCLDCGEASYEPKEQ